MTDAGSSQSRIRRVLGVVVALAGLPFLLVGLVSLSAAVRDGWLLGIVVSLVATLLFVWGISVAARVAWTPARGGSGGA